MGPSIDSFKYIKCILYICNAVFVIFGFYLAVLGIVMISEIGEITEFPNASNIKTLPTLIILLGIVTVSIAVFGSFGVHIEHSTFLTIYAGATSMLFLLQLSMVIWVYVNITKYPSSMSDLVNMAWLQNTPQNGYPMDTLQIQFDCCGRYGATDYLTAGISVPNSCCGNWISKDCPPTVYLRKPGCHGEFYDYWEGNNNMIGICGIISIVAQLTALFFTYHFVRELTELQRFQMSAFTNVFNNNN